MTLTGEKAEGPLLDFPRVGLASRLPGDARTVSTLLHLLNLLPRSAAHSMSMPSADHVSALLNIAFWASLQQEEGRPVAVPLSLQSPSSDEDLVFDHPLPLNVEAVVKLAPAVYRERRGLGIRTDGVSGLEIWGLPPMTPTAFCVDVKGPGLLVVKGMLRNVIGRVRDEHKVDLVLEAGVREQLRDLCTADLSNGGRGIGNQLESAFVNPLARAMFRFPLEGRTSISVTKIARDENRIMTVELS